MKLWRAEIDTETWIPDVWVAAPNETVALDLCRAEVSEYSDPETAARVEVCEVNMREARVLGVNTA